jgi:hypothetical protein
MSKKTVMYFLWGQVVPDVVIAAASVTEPAKVLFMFSGLRRRHANCNEPEYPFTFQTCPV